MNQRVAGPGVHLLKVLEQLVFVRREIRLGRGSIGSQQPAQRAVSAKRLVGRQLESRERVAAFGEAIKKFEAEVKEGKLVVIGAVFDFADDLRQGVGKLSIINVNGDTEAAKLAGFVGVNSQVIPHGV